MWSTRRPRSAPPTSRGAARDFLIQVRLVAAQFRWRNRLSATQQMRMYAPNWLRDAIAADLMLQAPGDNTMSTSFAEVDGYLDDANVDAVWYIDDVPVGVGTGATTAASNFDSYNGFAQTAEWLITSPGVFTRLDGGSIDLGVVRTKEDVQKNKFCEFSETFETSPTWGRRPPRTPGRCVGRPRSRSSVGTPRRSTPRSAWPSSEFPSKLRRGLATAPGT